MLQQQQQPQSGGGKIEVKGPSSTSDMHRLVAQQAAAAALKRHQPQNKPGHSGISPQAAASAMSGTDQLVNFWVIAASAKRHASCQTFPNLLPSLLVYYCMLGVYQAAPWVLGSKLRHAACS